MDAAGGLSRSDPAMPSDPSAENRDRAGTRPPSPAAPKLVALDGTGDGGVRRPHPAVAFAQPRDRTLDASPGLHQPLVERFGSMADRDGSEDFPAEDRRGSQPGSGARDPRRARRAVGGEDRPGGGTDCGQRWCPALGDAAGGKFGQLRRQKLDRHASSGSPRSKAANPPGRKTKPCRHVSASYVDLPAWAERHFQLDGSRWRDATLEGDQESPQFVEAMRAGRRQGENRTARRDLLADEDRARQGVARWLRQRIACAAAPGNAEPQPQRPGQGARRFLHRVERPQADAGSPSEEQRDNTRPQAVPACVFRMGRCNPPGRDRPPPGTYEDIGIEAGPPGVLPLTQWFCFFS